MTSEEIRNELISLIKKEFPSIRFRQTSLKSGNIRISPYQPNQKNKKRWMQLDANPGYLSIAMDHSVGDIKLEDLTNLNLQYGLNGSKSAIQIQKNDDAVNISIFTTDLYDFSNDKFVDFLHKHYQSYLKLIS